MKCLMLFLLSMCWLIMNDYLWNLSWHITSRFCKKHRTNPQYIRLTPINDLLRLPNALVRLYNFFKN